MNSYLLLLSEILLSLLASLLVLKALSTPLLNMLERVCPNGDAAQFWLNYTRVMLMMAPLLLVLVMHSFTRHSSPEDALRMALIAALLAMLIGMRVMGNKLSRLIDPVVDVGMLK